MVAFIPGHIIAALTFPGVVVHEFAHKLFCQWTGTEVHKVCYFRWGNPAGFVLHGKPSSVWRHILIGIGPFFINTIVGGMLGLVTCLWASHAKNSDASPSLGMIWMVMGWAGISIAMHAFPSTGDAKSIWRAIWERGAPLSAKIFGAPLVGIIFIGAFASIFWLDFFYGVGVFLGVPALFGIGGN